MWLMATTSSFLKNYHPQSLQIINYQVTFWRNPRELPVLNGSRFHFLNKAENVLCKIIVVHFQYRYVWCYQSHEEPGALSPLAGPVSALPLGAGKSEVVSYATETMIRKRGPSQAPNYFLDKALCPKQMRLLACGRENRNVCHLGILKTIAFCQINLPAMFAISLCWCPFLQNVILKRLRFQ